MDRRNFLQNTCPTITFAFFGLSYIQACSKSDDSDYNRSIGNNTSITINDNSGNTSTGNTSSGISVNGNIITLDLSNATFNGLNNPGDFINLTANQLLVLKIGSSEFRAFDNCCPHNGTRNKWGFGNDKFTCGEHGNSFSIDGNDIKSCNSGSTSGGLKRHTTSLNGQTLTVTT
ncbi:MAG: Rieske 2Fe-2S domain-containing protein [Pelagibacterales bacterium]|nr:Rieske 2Fe-2S domain-containing protein [Pelagibacterales bacterium]